MSIPDFAMMQESLVGAPDPEIVALEARIRAALVRGTYRYTRVWAQEADGAWRVVGGHVSAVPTAAPRPRS